MASRSTVIEKLGRMALLLVLFWFAAIAESNERGFSRERPGAVPDEELKIAIVVGVDEYDHVDNLNYAEADAKALAELFESQGYLVETILGFEAFGDRILDRIGEYSKLIDSESEEPSGSLVFAFSGHGFNNEQENFLATPDTDMNNLEETALRMSAVTRALKELNVRKRILFIDACRNNPTASNRSTDNLNGTFIGDDSEAEGLAIMYSTAKGSLSWEDPNLGKGVFTHYLVEGLKGAASGEQGLVSFDGLHKYVTRRVNRHVFESFRESQKPYKGGEWSGEFILARHEIRDAPDTDSLTSQDIEDSYTPPTSPITDSNPGSDTSEEAVGDFDFIQAAADLDRVRALFCAESDPKEGQTLKKQANAVFLGKYQYKGKRNEKRGWELYLDSMRLCNTAALMDISKTLAKRRQCETAIAYARLAAENGNRSAPRLVDQLSNRAASSCEG